MNIRKVYEQQLGTFWATLVLAIFAVVPITLLKADAPALEPFHLQFMSYEKNPSDGSYVFRIQFNDWRLPHINPHSFSRLRTFKIGDTIGSYKIIGFDVKIREPREDRDEVRVDESRIFLQSTTAADQKLVVPFRQEINAPLARFDP